MIGWDGLVIDAGGLAVDGAYFQQFQAAVTVGLVAGAEAQSLTFLIIRLFPLLADHLLLHGINTGGEEEKG